MLQTLWKISIRNLLKHRVYSSINVFGLTLGFTAFLLVALFLHNEFTWDKNNQHYDRIYRVQRHFEDAVHSMGGNEFSPHTRTATAKLLRERYPDFEKTTVIREYEKQYLSTQSGNLLLTQDGIAADENFFEVFTYKFMNGTTPDLSEPFTIVLSETTANRLFPDGNFTGRSLKLDKKYEFKLTGVYEDPPMNSSTRISYITSFSSLKTIENRNIDDIYNGDCQTFALLKEGVDSRNVNAKIKDVFAAYKEFNFEKLKLFHLSKLHLGYEEKNDYLIILGLFGLMGIFILIMSSFNYINLSAAKASERGKEIAIKKLNGSKRHMLITQFLMETTMIASAALVLAFGLTYLILPTFNTIVDKQIELNFILQWRFIALAVIALLLLGLISGIYPAFYLSSLRIINLIKAKNFSGVPGKLPFRKSLVMIQFAISVFLIGFTLFIAIQVNYLINKDLGLDKENVLYARVRTYNPVGNFDDLRNRLLEYPEIINGSVSRELPFDDIGCRSINWEGAYPDEILNVRYNTVSYDYLDNFKISLVAGRNFSRNYPADIGKAVIINETAAKCLGWSDPIGKRINNNQWRIIGVAKDYHYKDMHNVIEPNVLLLNSSTMDGENYYAFRIQANDLSKAKKILAQEFEQTFPFDPFEFEEFSNIFENEGTLRLYKSFKKSILFFALFNILLAIIGLLGLVSYNIHRRTKEIGIRKINGCKSYEVFIILNREYLRLILLSLIFAFPGIYICYQYFPGDYKLPLQPVLFIVSTIIILLTTLLTTSYHTYKASNRNPVEALRYE